jgi:hypothetical protein
MTAHPRSLPANPGSSILVMGLDRRIARFVVATLVIGGYMALGFAFRLGAEAYLLLGIPITIGFQILVVRGPVRSLWLRDAPSMTFTRRSMVAIVVLAVAPAIVTAGGIRDGDLAVFGWGLAAMVGAVGAVYALRAMDRDAVRTTIRTTLITGAVLVGIMVAYRLATGAFSGNLAAAMATAVISVATYLPVGGRHQETLPNGLRAFSAIAAAILVGGALVILARAGAIGWPDGAAGLLIPLSWAIAAFLVLNTLGNLASKSRIERTVFSATTATLAVLSAYVALS